MRLNTELPAQLVVPASLLLSSGAGERLEQGPFPKRESSWEANAVLVNDEPVPCEAP